MRAGSAVLTGQACSWQQSSCMAVWQLRPKELQLGYVPLRMAVPLEMKQFGVPRRGQGEHRASGAAS